MVEGRILSPLHRRFGPDQAILPSPPVSGPPNSLCTGLMARDIPTAQGGMRALVDSAVIQYNWADLNPTRGNLDMAVVAALVADLNWLNTNNGTRGQPLKGRLRILAGATAPQYVKDGCGSMIWYAKQGGQASGPPAPSDPTWRQMGTVPIWWNPILYTYWQEFLTLLVAQVGTHPALSEVTMSAGMTEYSEIFLHQFGNLENRTQALSLGWSVATDQVAFRTGFSVHASVLLPLGIATHVAFNPMDTIKNKTDPITGITSTVLRVDTSQAIVAMEAMAVILSRMGLWSNNSLIAPEDTRGDPYTLLYDREIAGRAQTLPFPWPIGYQTATLAKIQAKWGINGISTVPLCITDSISWGATSIELPSGCQSTSAGRDYISPSAAAAYNVSYAANRAPLLV